MSDSDMWHEMSVQSDDDSKELPQSGESGALPAQGDSSDARAASLTDSQKLKRKPYRESSWPKGLYKLGEKYIWRRTVKDKVFFINLKGADFAKSIQLSTKLNIKLSATKRQKKVRTYNKKLIIAGAVASVLIIVLSVIFLGLRSPSPAQSTPDEQSQNADSLTQVDSEQKVSPQTHASDTDLNSFKIINDLNDNNESLIVNNSAMDSLQSGKNIIDGDSENSKASAPSFNASRFNSGMDYETLQRIKSATVYIRDVNRRTGDGVVGSGFLIKKTGRLGYIVTNKHVISFKGTLSCVFNSGSKKEFTSISTQVLASVEDVDIAILCVDVGRFTLPEPIQIDSEVRINETMPVYIFGFPFGEMLASSSRSPSITIGQGTISSIRRDDNDMVLAIQIDGDMNPGNSGGPIVTPDGHLIGISVAKVGNSGIGFAVPTLDLKNILHGRIQAIQLEEAGQSAAIVRYKITCSIIDPMKQIRAINVLFVPEDKMKHPPKFLGDNGFEKIMNVEKKVPLIINGDNAVGEVALSKRKNGVPIGYNYQVEYISVVDNLPRYTDIIESGLPSSHLDDSKKPAAKTPPKNNGDTGEIKITGINQTVDSFPLPAEFTNVEYGGNGRYIIFNLHKLRKLAVFDIVKKKIVNYIDLEDSWQRTLYTAGKDRIVVANSKKNTIIVYSLPECKKLSTKRRAVRGSIAAIALGADSSGPLFVFWKGKKKKTIQCHYELFKLDKIQLMRLNYVDPNANIILSKSIHVRTSSDGRVFVVSGKDQYNRGCFIIKEFNDIDLMSKKICLLFNPDPVIPGPVGEYIYSSNYVYLNGETNIQKGFQESNYSTFIPTTSRGFFLKISFPPKKNSGRLYFYDMNKMELLLSTSLPRNYNKHNGDTGDLTYEKRFLYDIKHNKMVYLPYSNDRVILQDIDLYTYMKKYRHHYLVVDSRPVEYAKIRTTYEYQINVDSSSKVTYTLSSAPEGMTLSKTGKITWRVPYKLKGKMQTVIVTITNKDAEIQFHTFHINIQ